MNIELGGLEWRLVVEPSMRPAVEALFGLPVSDAQSASDFTVSMRAATAVECEHWRAFRAHHRMDDEKGILSFTAADGRAGRLSCVSLELDGGTEVEWLWLASPDEVVTHGGSLLLNVWMRRWRPDWFPVHGAVIGREGRFVLVPGESGAGKSTLTASALAAGWDIIGDDFVWVRRTAGGWQAEGPYAGVRLTPDARQRVAETWSSWSPAGHWTVRGDGKWVGFPDNGVVARGRLVGVVGLRPCPTAGSVERPETAVALMPAFRTSILLLNASGARAQGYLSATRSLLGELPLGVLPRSPDLSENLNSLSEWLLAIPLSC